MSNTTVEIKSDNVEVEQMSNTTAEVKFDNVENQTTFAIKKQDTIARFGLPIDKVAAMFRVNKHQLTNDLKILFGDNLIEFIEYMIYNHENFSTEENLFILMNGIKGSRIGSHECRSKDHYMVISSIVPNYIEIRFDTGFNTEYVDGVIRKLGFYQFFDYSTNDRATNIVLHGIANNMSFVCCNTVFNMKKEDHVLAFIKIIKYWTLNNLSEEEIKSNWCTGNTFRSAYIHVKNDLFV
jgi:hypothetical protein